MAAAPVAIPPRSDTLSPQEATDLNRATLESLRDSPCAPPERASSLSPSNALFHRNKPKSGAKKSGKKRQTSRQVEAVRAHEMDVVSASDEPVQGADGVLDLADELLDQLELDEPSAEPAPSESPSHSSSPLDKAGALVDSIGSKISSGLRGGSSRQAQRKVRVTSSDASLPVVCFCALPAVLNTCASHALANTDPLVRSAAPSNGSSKRTTRDAR